MSKDQSEGEPHRERDRRRREAAGGRQQAEDKNYFRDHAGQKPEAVEIPRLGDRFLRRSTLSEGLDRFLFAVEHFEDRQKLGHLQQISDALRQVGQLNGASGVVSRRI